MAITADGFEEESFGEWAKRVRLQKALSVIEVANHAGISHVALYKIERGDIANPRDSTRKGIEKALGANEPKQSGTKQPKEEIKGIGHLVDFDPYDLETVPNESGVYVFYDVSQRPVYVGRSKRLRSRIKTHVDRFWFKEPIVVSGSFIEIRDESLRDQVESILIKFLKSNAVINRSLVDRDLEE